jgi:hypothetical protein
MLSEACANSRGVSVPSETRDADGRTTAERLAALEGAMAGVGKLDAAVSDLGEQLQRVLLAVESWPRGGGRGPLGGGGGGPSDARSIDGIEASSDSHSGYEARAATASQMQWLGEHSPSPQPQHTPKQRVRRSSSRGTNADLATPVHVPSSNVLYAPAALARARMGTGLREEQVAQASCTLPSSPAPGSYAANESTQPFARIVQSEDDDGTSALA